MADDARETQPRLTVSDSRLSWERGVVPPPFEASQTWAVELAVNLAHGRVQRMPPVLVSNGLAVQLTSCCATPTRARPAATTLLSSTSCELSRPCTSASRLMGRRECCHTCRWYNAMRFETSGRRGWGCTISICSSNSFEGCLLSKRGRGACASTGAAATGVG